MPAQSEIFGAMIRSRDYCRNILRLYDSVRYARGRERVKMLRKVNECADALSSQLERLPIMPVQATPEGARRDYIQRLCTEVGDLMTQVMVMERECRSTETVEKMQEACHA